MLLTFVSYLGGSVYRIGGVSEFREGGAVGSEYANQDSGILIDGFLLPARIGAGGVLPSIFAQLRSDQLLDKKKLTAKKNILQL